MGPRETGAGHRRDQEFYPPGGDVVVPGGHPASPGTLAGSFDAPYRQAGAADDICVSTPCIERRSGNAVGTTPCDHGGAFATICVRICEVGNGETTWDNQLILWRRKVVN